MENVRRILRYLLSWTTLYTQSSTKKVPIPDRTLKFIGKKTWYLAKSREYGFRFLLYVIMFTISDVSIYWTVRHESVHIKVFALTGGLYLGYSLVRILLRFIYVVFTGIFGSNPKNPYAGNSVWTNIRIGIQAIVIFPFVWGLSTGVYFLFYLPIYGIVWYLTKMIPLIGTDGPIIVASVMAYACVSLLQYWRYKPQKKETK